MKTYFADPELKVIRFEAKDILTTSPGGGDNELPPNGFEDENP